MIVGHVGEGIVSIDRLPRLNKVASVHPAEWGSIKSFRL